MRIPEEGMVRFCRPQENHFTQQSMHAGIPSWFSYSQAYANELCSFNSCRNRLALPRKKSVLPILCSHNQSVSCRMAHKQSFWGPGYWSEKAARTEARGTAVEVKEVS